MPSLGDSAVIFLLALLLFGPKKLPELARQLGKIMGEFRKASAEFRMQMEDELRVSEQAERQKQIAAIEAAAPIATTLGTETTAALPGAHDTLGETSWETRDDPSLRLADASDSASSDSSATWAYDFQYR